MRPSPPYVDRSDADIGVLYVSEVLHGRPRLGGGTASALVLSHTLVLYFGVYCVFFQDRNSQARASHVDFSLLALEAIFCYVHF